MMMRLLAASALTIGLATSALAQSAETTSGSHRNWLFETKTRSPSIATPRPALPAAMRQA